MGISTHYNNGDVSVIGVGNALTPDTEFPLPFTVAHEMLHKYNPTYPGLEMDAIEQNQNTERNSHDELWFEKHSDIEGLRYLLYKEGIYDSRGKKDATAEDIKKLREKYPELRPLLQMDDEKAAWMINHVADANEEIDMSNIAASGGIIERSRPQRSQSIHIKPENNGGPTDDEPLYNGHRKHDMGGPNKTRFVERLLNAPRPGGQLEPAVVTPGFVWTDLHTYPISKNWPITHSELDIWHVRPYSGSKYTASKYFEDPSYNLLTNNCSDFTGRILGRALNTKLTSDFITTPYDVMAKALKYTDETLNIDGPDGPYISQAIRVPWYDARKAEEEGRQEDYNDIMKKIEANTLMTESQKQRVKTNVTNTYNEQYPKLPYILGNNGAVLHIKNTYDKSPFPSSYIQALNARWKHDDGGPLSEGNEDEYYGGMLPAATVTATLPSINTAHGKEDCKEDGGQLNRLALGGIIERYGKDKIKSALAKMKQSK